MNMFKSKNKPAYGLEFTSHSIYVLNVDAHPRFSNESVDISTGIYIIFNVVLLL